MTAEATRRAGLKSFRRRRRVEPECFRQLRRSRLLLRTQVCCTAIAVVFAPLAALVAVVTAAAHHTNTVLQHECNSPRTLMQSCCLLDFVPFSVWVPIRSGCEDGFEAYSPSPSSAACDPASIKCCLEAHPSPKPKAQSPKPQRKSLPQRRAAAATRLFQNGFGILLRACCLGPYKFLSKGCHHVCPIMSAKRRTDAVSETASAAARGLRPQGNPESMLVTGRKLH